MNDIATLDNSIWHALRSRQQRWASGTEQVLRYPADVAAFAGLREATPAAFADLHAITTPGERLALFTAGPLTVPDGWHALRQRVIDQMLCEDAPLGAGCELIALGAEDVPDMLALTAATEPGPFYARTHEMGRYLGLRSPDGRLMAMVGERLALDGFTEVSAVCTDPDFRGQGLARALVVSLCHLLRSEGTTPFLHVKTELGARLLYEKIGFRFRRGIHLTVMSPA
jgi:ribosomal protein S18 acetylase RimI-like enzyme